ncbi:MAG TPA: hypothetical protein VKV74_10780 [Bryobacteraceae bacterium]|nr:hypothetical protein [Bryobacteraceae bacterium]
MNTGSFRPPPEPVLYRPTPHFADTVNRSIIQSEIEGGVDLRNLTPGSVISIRTTNHLYRIEVVEEDTALISGHPEFCPDPVAVRIHGSTWGGSMLRVRFVGRGMHLEFEHPVHKRIVTSRILDIQADQAA